MEVQVADKSLCRKQLRRKGEEVDCMARGSGTGNGPIWKFKMETEEPGGGYITAEEASVPPREWRANRD